jgi:RNA polymerase primary sigma factor
MTTLAKPRTFNPASLIRLEHKNELTRLAEADRNELRELLDSEPDYMVDPLFESDNAERDLFEAPPVELPEPHTTWYHALVINPTDRRLEKEKENVLLNKDQERLIFLQFNYARYRLATLLEEVAVDDITLDEALEILKWNRLARHLRDRIAEFNLALVLAMIRRVRSADLDFNDLMSEGNMALLRAIDKFNISKGFKFSTYACRAILKSFSRLGTKSSRYKDLFPVTFDPALERSNHAEEEARTHEEQCADEVKRIVAENRADLSEVEVAVIRHRFALDTSDEATPMTLEQVGRVVGFTKERVRQIQNQALEKIRITLESDYLDGKPMPDLD